MWPNQSSLEDPFPIARFCKAASILASGTAPAVDWCSRTSHMLGRSCTRQVLLRNYSNINFELAHWIWKKICTIPITCLWWAPKRSKIKKYFPFALINHHLMHKGLEESNPLAAGGLRPLAKLESMGHQDSDGGGLLFHPILNSRIQWSHMF